MDEKRSNTGTMSELDQGEALGSVQEDISRAGNLMCYTLLWMRKEVTLEP